MEEIPQIPFQPEQGAIQNCIYCNLIYPETKGNCPECNNTVSNFRPAQMMDSESSSRMILNLMNEIDLSDFHDIEQAEEKRKKLISVLREIVLYKFNIQEAIITMIKDLDMEIPSGTE